MNKIIKLSMTAAVSLLLLSSCQNVRTSDGDISLVGKSVSNGEVIEYKSNGEVVRNGKIGHYKIVDDNTIRVYTDNNRPDYGDLYNYSKTDGKYNFGSAAYVR